MNATGEAVATQRSSHRAQDTNSGSDTDRRAGGVSPLIVGEESEASQPPLADLYHYPNSLHFFARSIDDIPYDVRPTHKIMQRIQSWRGIPFRMDPCLD